MILKFDLKLFDNDLITSFTSEYFWINRLNVNNYKYNSYKLSLISRIENK